MFVAAADHNSIVVDELSARIGLPNEKLFQVDANHRTICKIPSAKSQEYNAVGVWIAKLVKMAVKDTGTKEVQCKFDKMKCSPHPC